MEDPTAAAVNSFPGFVIISVLGAPGAGKGTISTYLAQKYSLKHYSIGDDLRSWMRENRATTLAIQIQDKLDNQGFLSFEELSPFLQRAIENAKSKHKGILIDGFPRCIEQQKSFSTWPLQDILSTYAEEAKLWGKPGIVLMCQVTRQNAEARYSVRKRDSNDSERVFQARFAEYEAKTIPVVDMYRQRGIVIDVDLNGTKEENIENLARNLDNNMLWQEKFIGRGAVQCSELEA